MKNILAISGSLRAESTNLKIIEYVAKLAAKHLSFSLYQGLSALPAFNPDLDGEGANMPAEVDGFRRRIKEAEGNLITANGLSPIEFGREIINLLKIYSDEDAENWFAMCKHGVYWKDF